MTLVDKEFKGLEGWMANDANPKTIELTRWLTEGLSDNEARWECESQLEILATLTKTGQHKLDYIEELLGKLQTQVLGAPLAESDKDEDTSKARPYDLRKLDQAFEEAKAAFARWKTSGKRVKEEFKKITSDKTTVKEENAKEAREERGLRRKKIRTKYLQMTQNH